MTIALIFLEQGKQPPATIAGRLADFLAAARSSLHLAIYDFRLSDPLAAPVVQALRQRAAARVDVRIVYDAGKPKDNVPRSGGDPAPPGTADFIRRIGNGIQSRAITGGDPQQPRLMHHKYIIRDGGTPAAALWTGSANFTDDSWTLQENNLLQIDSPELCRYYETDFSELWQRGDIATTGEHDRGTVAIGPSQVEVAFSPGEGPAIDHLIAHLIGRARRRLKMCSMLITSGTILGALNDVLHHNRVQEYGGVYDRTQMEGVFGQWRGQPSEWKVAAFKEAAAPLAGKCSTPYTPMSPHDFMHNKVLVADDAVLTGSYNLSHSATENAENVLVIHDAAIAERYNEYINHLVERYQRQS
jgi:phosphatidylserine/phosphatidylglycerophosphate/cardiolipin synthase-like enzyme